MKKIIKIIFLFFLFVIIENQAEAVTVPELRIKGDNEVKIGETIQLYTVVAVGHDIVGDPDFGTWTESEAGYDIEWKSSNTSIATVDANGLVTGVAKGKTTITAERSDKDTVEEFEKATIEITVKTDTQSGLDDEIINKKLSTKTTKEGINYLTGFDIETPISKVITGNFKENYTVKIYKGEKEIINSTEELVGTGTIINIYNGDELINTYKVILYGDTTGDGKVDSLDALAIINNQLGKEQFFDECCYEAARITEESRINDAVPSSVDALFVIKSKLSQGTVDEEKYKIVQKFYKKDEEYNTEKEIYVKLYKKNYTLYFSSEDDELEGEELEENYGKIKVKDYSNDSNWNNAKFILKFFDNLDEGRYTYDKEGNGVYELTDEMLKVDGLEVGIYLKGSEFYSYMNTDTAYCGCHSIVVSDNSISAKDVINVLKSMLIGDAWSDVKSKIEQKLNESEAGLVWIGSEDLYVRGPLDIELFNKISEVTEDGKIIRVHPYGGFISESLKDEFRGIANLNYEYGEYSPLIYINVIKSRDDSAYWVGDFIWYELKDKFGDVEQTCFNIPYTFYNFGNNQDTIHSHIINKELITYKGADGYSIYFDD